MCLFFALLLETVYADTIWNHVILIFGVHIIQNRIFGRNLESYVSLLWLVLRNRTRGHNLESLDSPFLIIIINRTQGHNFESCDSHFRSIIQNRTWGHNLDALVSFYTVFFLVRYFNRTRFQKVFTTGQLKSMCSSVWFSSGQKWHLL